MIKNLFVIVNCLTMLFVVGCFGKGRLKPIAIEAQNDIYIFVQLTDNHLGADPKCSKITENLIKEINKYKDQRPIDFIAITGDLFDGRQYNSALDDYKYIQKKSDFPIHALAGNHDYNLQRAGIADKAVGGRNAELWKENFGAFNYYVDIRNVRFIFMSTECLISGIDTEKNDFYKWLEARLDEASGCSKDIIIFTHMPIVKNFYKGRLSSAYSEHEYQKLEQLLQKYKVNAIVAGHFHFEELDMLGNIPVYVCPASVNRLCDSGKFRVYEYNTKNKFLKYKTFEIQ